MSVILVAYEFLQNIQVEEESTLQSLQSWDALYPPSPMSEVPYLYKFLSELGLTMTF